MTGREPGIGDLLTLGVTLASTLVAGFGLGWLVDLLLHSFPIFAFVGLALSTVAAGALVYRLSKKFM